MKILRAAALVVFLIFAAIASWNYWPGDVGPNGQTLSTDNCYCGQNSDGSWSRTPSFTVTP